MSYVICPEKLTPAVLDPHSLAMGLTPNMPCALRCEVVTEAPAMQFRCARGHSFFATPAEVRREH